MSIASITSAPAPKPVVTPPTAKEMDLGIGVAETVTGKPVSLETASASATTRFAIDAPTGAELRVTTPDGVDLEGRAWANKGRTGVEFARDGADWVATAKEPLHQISLRTNAFHGRGDAISVTGSTINLRDISPKLSVNGVARDDAGPEVLLVAPQGWKTTTADGTPDDLHTVQGLDDAVSATRDGSLGAATIATFTGMSPEGKKTTGPKRVLHEAAQRTVDAATGAAYIAMMLTGRAG